MMNEKLIMETIKLITDYFEAENIYVATSIIDAQARDWYNHSEIYESEMLAAVVMSYGYYKAGFTWNELEQLRDFYFPSSPIEETIARIGGYFFDEEAYVKSLNNYNYHIGEIEAAQRDYLWQ